MTSQLTSTGPRGMAYTTFMPGPVAPPQVPISSFQSQTLGGGQVPFVSLPMSSRTQVPSSTAQQGSTPNSSISNMACLPEDQRLDDRLSNHAVTHSTPSPPPAPTPPISSS